MLECCGVCASGRSRPGAVPARPSVAGWREAGTWSVCSPETAGHVMLTQIGGLRRGQVRVKSRGDADKKELER